jgi:hypothetical protein
MSSCITANESPAVALNTVQHAPLSFATPDSDQRKLITEVHAHSNSRVGLEGKSQNINSRGNEMNSVTPSSVATLGHSGNSIASKDTRDANANSRSTSSTAASSPTVMTSTGRSTSAEASTTNAQTSSEVSIHTLPLNSQLRVKRETADGVLPLLKKTTTSTSSGDNIPSLPHKSSSGSKASTSGDRPASRNIKPEPMVSSSSRHQSEGTKSKSKKVTKNDSRSTTPVPPTSGRSQSQNFKMKTPVRSPKNGIFQGYNSELPSFGSPSLFLSPCLLSPSVGMDRRGSNQTNNQANNRSIGQENKIPVGGITPTNFASDFGKNDMNDDALNNGTSSNLIYFILYIENCMNFNFLIFNF